MKTTTSLLGLIVLVTVVAQHPVVAQQPPRESSARDASTVLRERVQQRYNVVPITNGVALTPKRRNAAVRLIEVTDTIAVNGTVVTGGELRELVGGDADLVLQLSYIDVAARQALAPPPLPPAPPALPDVEKDPSTPDRDRAREAESRARDAAAGRGRSGGDRVNIFGDVRVREDEYVSGQVVAVLGSVKIEGEVGDQVVAVLGSVDLGPKAVVRGDIVSVGGRVNRAEGAQVRGAVTEVALGRVPLPDNIVPWMSGVGLFSLGSFGAVPRLIGSTFRLLLLITLGALAYILARRSVEQSAERVQDNPVKATFVGLAAGLLIGPILFIAAFVLVLTIIGIPLLLLIPFLLAFLVLLALVGFTGTAAAVGQWASRRFGIGSGVGLGSVVLGIGLIFLPLMLARLMALGGWMTAPFSFVLGGAAFGFELLVWAAGFGAVLSNTFGSWRARRTTIATA
jgi:hypothetical protein